MKELNKPAWFVIASLFLCVFALDLSLSASPYVLILGTAQDAGVPQMGCDTPFCRKAWRDPKLREMVSSIALVDPDSGSRWIFDATPDLPEQFELLKSATGDRSNRIDGVFLTHAHIGHYTGLMYLGRESMNTYGVKVYAMPRMKTLLEQNAPWSQLVDLGNIDIRPLADKTPILLNDRLSVEPFLVPHRDEFSETVGYRIRSGSKTIVYIPDIDKWQKWSTRLTDVIRSSDRVLIDGTFYADGEIARPMSEVPHPFVSETMALLKDLPAAERGKVYFIHFNHSNPLVQKNAAKLKEVTRSGFHVAKRGLKLVL
jgi:pyrroloquinoline quinone biosynthesis protein B